MVCGYSLLIHPYYPWQRESIVRDTSTFIVGTSSDYVTTCLLQMPHIPVFLDHNKFPISPSNLKQKGGQ